MAAQGRTAQALALYNQGLAQDPWAFYKAFEAFPWALQLQDTAQAEVLLGSGVRHGLNLGLFADNAQLQAFLERPAAGQFRVHLEEDHRALTAPSSKFWIPCSTGINGTGGRARLTLKR